MKSESSSESPPNVQPKAGLSPAQKKRAPLFLLLVVLLGLMWWMSSRRPIEVHVQYELPAAARAGLRCLHLVWEQDGETKLEGRLYVSAYEAPLVHSQTVDLPPGDYDIIARFEYADGQQRSLRVQAQISRNHKEMSMTLNPAR